MLCALKWAKRHVGYIESLLGQLPTYHNNLKDIGVPTEGIPDGIFDTSSQKRELSQSLITVPCYGTTRSIQGNVSTRHPTKFYPNTCD